MRISFDIKQLKKICDVAKEQSAKMMLVKDEGVYIMYRSTDKANSIIYMLKV